MAPTLPSSFSPHICVFQSPDLQQLLVEGSLPPLSQLLQSFCPLSQGEPIPRTDASLRHSLNANFVYAVISRPMYSNYSDYNPHSCTSCLICTSVFGTSGCRASTPRRRGTARWENIRLDRFSPRCPKCTLGGDGREKSGA